ncbi:MAG: hypothetical protein KatS3mg008_0953 [Acidimicrobiales bacterium]|nr:MAG: hypothetical protein KatS3mg008_0953 [Acidimicrobiales bacterium]
MRMPRPVNEQDHDLEGRLRRLGAAPIDQSVRSRHLAAVRSALLAEGHAAGVPGSWASPWRRRLRTAAAFAVGLLLGGTGLATAGALPGPAQDAAADVLSVFGLDVPRSTEGCPAGKTYRNHGEFVSEVASSGGDAAEAARSACGKPLRGAEGGTGKARDQEGAGARTGRPGEKDPCRGRPPWAGKGLPEAEEARLEAERDRACADRADERSSDGSGYGSGSGGDEGVDATPTTAPPTTAPPDEPRPTTSNVLPSTTVPSPSENTAEAPSTAVDSPPPELSTTVTTIR